MGQTSSLIRGSSNSLLVDGLALVDSYFNYIQTWSNTPQGFCKIADHVGELMPRVRDSVSASQILFGKKEQEDIALKVFYEPRKDNNGLLVEGEIYEQVIQRILAEKHSPNVLKFYAFAKCDKSLFSSLKQIINPQYHTAYEHGIKDLDGIVDVIQTDNLINREPVYRPENVCLLAIEKASNCMSLHDWLDYPHSREEILSVFFQIFFTLEVFNRYGLRHNDLHLANILIQDNKQTQIYEYKFEGKSYYLPMRFKAFIFDFDRGAVSGSGKAKLIFNSTIANIYCNDFGTCNDFNPKFDVFKLVCGLKTRFNKSWLTDFYNDITNIAPDGDFCFLPKQYAKDRTPPDSRTWEAYSRAVKSRKTGATTAGQTQEEFLLPVLDILHHSIFMQFEKQIGPVVDSYTLPQLF